MSMLRNSLLYLLLLWCRHGVRSQDNKMYSYLGENSTILRNGDMESEFIKLDTPIHFFSQTFDHIYINTNGILSFEMPLPVFFFHRMMLMCPSIAVFYSNVDTTAANESQISFFKSQSPDKLSKASDLVRNSFSGSQNFTATILYVATWEKVGYYMNNNDKTNTFQVALICDQDDTYVQLIYPSNGLNWLKADDRLGVQNIWPQAGFMWYDERYYALPGSRTDNVRYLSTLSNIDIPGVWLFRVGPLSNEQNVELPSIEDSEPRTWTDDSEESEPSSCTNGYKSCDLHAVCINKARGYCCKCNEGYYGNGNECIKSTVPIRVSGLISGSINGKRLHYNAKLQSYVALPDGRTYSAINPISEELGYQLEMALPLGGAIGWLFGKPFGKAKNGFDITGGILNHLSTLTFNDSGEVFIVNQTFKGLDYSNLLDVAIDLSGNLPIIPVGSKPQMADFMEEYRYIAYTEIQSVGTRQIRVSDTQNIKYTLDQRITFKRCRLDNETSLESENPLIRKVSKVSWDYDSEEDTIIIKSLNRIGVDLESNYTDLNESKCYNCSRDAICLDNKCTCNDGFVADGSECTAICGPGEVWINSNCLQPDFGLMSCFQDYNCHEKATCEWSEDVQQHKCICQRGYDGDGITCTEIEVLRSTKPVICDIHATRLYNETNEKSKCRCNNGYEWNGYSCLQVPTCSTNAPCKAYSKCENGFCHCLAGYERNPVSTDFCSPDFCERHRHMRICAANALCKIQPKGMERMHHCECMEGFVGDGYHRCEKLPLPCNIQNDCSLDAICAPSKEPPFIHKCICDPGYYGDGYLCVEERNCQNTPSLCDPNGRCVTDSIRPECRCKYGYVGNGTYCKEKTYIINFWDIKVVRIPIDERFGKPISVARMAFGLDKDCVEKRIYWGDVSAKMIISSKYNGEDEKPFVTEDILSPDDIAIDWMSRRLYWTDSIKATIEVVSLDNPKERAVLVNKNLVYPRGIAVDPHKSKIYWSDWYRDAPKIEMAELDGTGREILLSTPDVILPNSLAVLRRTGELCFADGGTYKIGCVDTSTKSVRTIAANLSYPFGLTSTNQIFCWINWNTKQIESVDINGSRKTGRRTIIFGVVKMYGLVPIRDDCPVNDNPCQVDNGGCPEDQICLINQRAPSGKSCK